MKDEIWKDIHGYEGSYQVSNLGRIRSLYRPVGDGTNRHWHGRVMKPTGNGNGYLIVGLRDRGKRKNHYIHRLVAEHFLPDWEDGMEVDHIDYNKGNNASGNLRMVTRQENIDHSYDRMRAAQKHRRKSVGRSGVQYIWINHGKYVVGVPKTKPKRFDTIEEAKKYREEILNETESQAQHFAG